MNRLMLAAVLVASSAQADTFQPSSGTYQAKKDRERLGKSLNHPPPPANGSKPAKLVNLYNRWTHDWLAVDPTKPPSAAEVSSFLRDHFTNETTAIDARLLPTVLAAAAYFRSDLVEVVSAFRHPKYNLMLRKKGRQVARDSEHTHGTAIDFTLPNVPTMRLRAWAVAQRLGGVGVYLASGFVHVDTGRIRFWSGD